VIRNVIFDWSGTLVDDLAAVWQASNHVLRQAGVREMTLEEFRAEFRLPFTLFYDRYVPHISFAQLETWFHESFMKAQGSVVALAHAREFLEFCRASGLRTLLLSTVHPAHYAMQAQSTGLGSYLDHPYLGIWDKRQKIHEIIEKHGLDPAETVFIGDMQHDVETARHGGVHSCAVLTGYNRLAQLREAKPDIIVEHLGEFRSVLERERLQWPVAPGASRTGEVHPIPTVGALIFNDAGEVLMVRTRKWSGLWGIPGGKMRRGETAEAALRREICEETQLAVRDIEFVLVQDCIDSTEFYRSAHFLLLNYVCRVEGAAAVTLNDEAEAWQWVALPAALQLPLNRPTRVLIEAVQSRKLAWSS